jgi:hypothetical protein
MSEEDLIEKGVAALGARRKMLKVFEQVRNELELKVNENLMIRKFYIENSFL